MTVDITVVTGGHPFSDGPFFAMVDALGFTWSATSEPEPGHDVVVFYDMPGFSFTRDPDDPVHFHDPTDEQRAVLDRLQRDGTGLVFLHHALAGWPTWPAYAELIGGRFHYRPASLRSVEYPDSGYVFDVTHAVEVVAPDHPVCHGLDTGFTLTDELYCCPVFEDDVTPLLRTTFDTTDAGNFWSADHAIRGRVNDRSGWTHPPGSDLVGWTRSAGNSRLVYLQFGDGPTTYADPNFRTVLGNAIEWTASITS